MTDPQRLLDFWFGGPADPHYGSHRKIWFEKDPAFDAELRRRFAADYEAAASGALDDWRHQPTSCLALILLLDQLPRNLFRGSPRAFATDARARDATDHAIAAGHDRILPAFTRKFVYMPYMHSESLDDQRRSLALFETLGEEQALQAARRHLEIIERFGRFPHRNAVLGRASTAAELAFLEEPNSSF